MSESLKQRVITAILMGAPILLLLFMNDTTRIVFISLLAILLLYEYLSLFYPIKSKLFHYLISFVIAIVLMFVAYSYQEYYLPLLFVSLAVNVILIINLCLPTLFPTKYALISLTQLSRILPININ